MWVYHPKIWKHKMVCVYINVDVCGKGYGEARGPEASDSVQCGPSWVYRYR